MATTPRVKVKSNAARVASDALKQAMYVARKEISRLRTKQLSANEVFTDEDRTWFITVATLIVKATQASSSEKPTEDTRRGNTKGHLNLRPLPPMHSLAEMTVDQLKALAGDHE